MSTMAEFCESSEQMVRFRGDHGDSQHIPIMLSHRTFFLAFTASPKLMIKLYIFSLDCKFREVDHMYLLPLYITQMFNKVC